MSLTKTRTVLYRTESGEFEQFENEGDRRLHVLTIDPHVWDEMGRPSILTVTIEPGDLLND